MFKLLQGVCKGGRAKCSIRENEEKLPQLVKSRKIAFQGEAVNEELVWCLQKQSLVYLTSPKS